MNEMNQNEPSKGTEYRAIHYNIGQQKKWGLTD